MRGVTLGLCFRYNLLRLLLLLGRHTLVVYALKREVGARGNEADPRANDVFVGIELLFALFHQLALERGAQRAQVAEVYDVAVLYVCFRHLADKRRTASTSRR